MLWLGVVILEDVGDPDYPAGVVADREMLGPFDNIDVMSDAVDARHDEAEIDQAIITFPLELCDEEIVPEIIECEQAY
jgi:hypothetical protein